MGRALVELGRLDEALTELTAVLDAAPGNLPAIRALAEIYQRRGMMSEALVHYRRALQLAEQDTPPPHSGPQGHEAAEPRSRQAESSGAAPAPIADLFDFDSLLAQLDVSRGGAPAALVPLKLPAQTPLETDVPPGDDDFAEMERRLREREEERLQEEKQARQAEAERRRMIVIQELEDWLSAIVVDRHSRPSV